MSDALPLPTRPNVESYQELAVELEDACKSSDDAAFLAWAKRAAGSERKARGMKERWRRFREHHADCALTATQSFVAREHGFASWPKFAAHVEALSDEASGVATFEAAVDAIISGDEATLRNLLARRPELTDERSTREHESMLLHYVSANGVEDFRQKTPPNIVEITKLLLNAGADVNAESTAYGGSTTITLVATSVHPQEAGLQMQLLQTLLDHGARWDDSIVAYSFANGQPEAAAFFAYLGAKLTLDTSAALGKLEAVRDIFPRASTEERVTALISAAGWGHRKVVEFLLDQGVEATGRNAQGQTALHWACFSPHLDIVQLLLSRGASATLRDDHFHGNALDYVLWEWRQSRDERKRNRCCEAAAVLRRAGAEFDREHWTGPDGRSTMADTIEADARMKAALRADA